MVDLMVPVGRYDVRSRRVACTAFGLYRGQLHAVIGEIPTVYRTVERKSVQLEYGAGPVSPLPVIG